MLPVSQEFFDAVKAGVRDFRAKLEITWTDPYLDQSIIVTANENAEISWLNQVADGIEEVPYKWESCDGSSLTDGTYHPCPDTEELAFRYQMGWWGRQIAGVGGAFSAPYPTLTVSFSKRPVFGLKVVGDNMRQEYPVDFEIRIYDGQILMHTETVTGNASVKWQSETIVNSATKMVLEIHKWSHEGRQAKIVEFFTSVQVLYFDDDIGFVGILEERDISTGSLPIGNITANEADIKLNNIDDRYTAGNESSPFSPLVRPNRKIRIWLGLKLPDGIIEYLPMGTFWTGDWQGGDNEVYISTSARDRMEMLRKTTFSSSEVYQNYTLYQLAEIVLQDAQAKLGELFAYWIDTELQEYVIPWAYFESMSHRKALRLIVEACCGQTYVDRNDVIRIEGPSFIKPPV